jgi:hypothetical protein
MIRIVGRILDSNIDPPFLHGVAPALHHVLGE